MIRSHKPWAWVVILGLTLTALVAGGTPAPPAHEGKKFKAYLSMFVSGGGWVTAASNAIKALAATPPYDSMVGLEEVISGPEPQKQVASGDQNVMLAKNVSIFSERRARWQSSIR